jgi:hypothetical protein
MLVGFDYKSDECNKNDKSIIIVQVEGFHKFLNLYIFLII